MEATVEQTEAPASPAEPTSESINESLGLSSREQASEPPADGQAQPPAGFDESKIQSLIESALKQALNPIQSELGQFRKVRSEFDQLKNRKPETQTQPPSSWAELTPDQQRATRDLINHVLQDVLGEKLSAYDQALEAYRGQETIGKVVNVAQSYAGADFEKLNPIMGKIVNDISREAENGNDSAAVFLNEINTTQSGVLRLVDMAKQEYAKTVEAQAAKAKAEQSEKAKRAGTALGNTGATSGSGVSLNNLPSDPKKKLEALERMMKESGRL